jgi:hypothetical protein
MGLLQVLTVIGLLLLITIAVASIVNVGQENAQARSRSAATAAFRRQVREPRWRQVGDVIDILVDVRKSVPPGGE